MPFKMFTTGELVTAADANTYWGQQAIATFPDRGRPRRGDPRTRRRAARLPDRQPRDDRWAWQPVDR